MEFSLQQNHFLHYIRNNECELEKALEITCISKADFDEWLFDNDFYEAYQIALQPCEAKVINAMYKKGLSGDVEAAKYFILKNNQVPKTALDPLGLDIMGRMNG